MELFEKLPLVLDGATGTEMMKHGYKNGECFEKWILENPEHLKELQRDYIGAGSDIIYAPTFGANRFLLEKYGHSKDVREMNLRLAEISLEVSGGKVPVAGDIAPTGAVLEPYGDVTSEKLAEVYSEQIRSLEEAGVDLYIIETQISGEEAKIALNAVRTNSKKPVFVSFTCTENGKTFYGEEFSSLLSEMQALGAAAFGINCSGDFELIKKIVAKLNESAKIPLLVKPNAGKPKVTNGRNEYSLKPGEFAEEMTKIKNLGASLLGGCCGTDKNHISALVKAIK